MRNIWLIIHDLKILFPLKKRVTVTGPAYMYGMKVMDPFYLNMRGEVVGYDIYQNPGEPTTFLVVCIMDNNQKLEWLPDQLK